MHTLYEMHAISLSNMIPNHGIFTQLYDVIFYKCNNLHDGGTHYQG